ncbi:MAG TPA: energy transducer TonB [Pyrinomonadaceae bacterium]
MKSLTFNFRVALPALLCCFALARTAGAQEGDAARAWVKVAPPNEAFTVLMPRLPFPVAERGASGALNVEGRRYSLRHDNAEYTVWSFKAAKLPTATGDERETYLDRCAEVAWNLMIEPYWEKLRRESPDELMKYSLTYDRTVDYTSYPGRRYRVRLDEQSGSALIYAIRSRIYIVAAWGAEAEARSVERFVDSFSSPDLWIGGVGGPIGPTIAKRSEMDAPRSPADSSTPSGLRVEPGLEGFEGGVGGKGKVAGSGEKDDRAVNDTKPFSAKDVSQKARILGKPEPSYTEWARRFGVTGTVRLRLVLLPSGEVGNITTVTRLPHGLTPNAINAARRIKFTPAMKDGRAVAQYVTFEYNFNIY